MHLRQILKTSGIALGVIVVLAVLWLWFADFSRFKPNIEAMVSNATGREFVINGRFGVKVLPSPTVWVEDASLANASWGSDSEMVEVGHLSARIGLWSLLFRPVIIHGLRLSQVTVLLETHSDGTVNWDFGDGAGDSAESETDSGDGSWPIDLRQAEIGDVHIVYRRPESDDTSLTLESLTVDTDDAGRKALEGLGRWIDTPFEISGTAELRGDTIHLSDLVAGSKALRLTVDGDLDRTGRAMQLSIQAQGKDLDLMPGGLSKVPYSGTAGFSLIQGAATLDPFVFTFGESDIAGRIRYESGEPPKLSLQARSALIDLSSPGAESEEDEDLDKVEGESESPFVFKDQPFPIRTLHQYDADLDLEVERFKASSTQLDHMEVAGTIDHGVLQLDASFNGPFGGTFESRISVATSGDRANLEMTGKARELKLGMLSGPDMPPEHIPESRLDLDISASGSTWRALAASTSGKVIATAGAGRVKNEILDNFFMDIIAQLFSALNPFAKEDEFTNWECSVFAVDFESGRGDISGFLFQSEKIQVVGGGEIDLNTEELNLEFNTKPRQGIGVTADMFVTPFVKLGGTLKHPSIGLNKKGLLLSGGAAVLTGGLSFLYKGLMDRATAEKGRCEKALEEVGLGME